MVSGRLQAGPRGLELGGDERRPRARHRSRRGADERLARSRDEARAAVEAAAVAGQRFDLHLAGRLASEDGLAELRAPRHPARGGDGRAAFRHALSWEAFYADVPWLRRRALHRQLAEALEAGGGQAMEVATHWLGARDAARARAALVRAVEESEAVYAYRDATAAGRQALELWPGDEDPAARLEVLERYARCAELAGELPEAVKAWRELSAVRSARGERLAFADAQRRLAGRLRAQGRARGRVRRAARRRRHVRRRRPARRRRARAARDGQPPPRRRRLRARRSSSRAPPPPRPTRAGRADLRARALGLEGVARAKRGEFEAGLETVRDGLGARARRAT